MRTIVCHWDGRTFTPIRTMATSTRNLEPGRYAVDVIEERSAASHKQYFAAVREAWSNLDEEALARYPTANHLRKWALIKAGYAKEATFVLDTPEHAAAAALFMRGLDDTAVVVVKGNVIKTYVAMSQSRSSMKKEQFEASKRDVLTILSGQIGVSRKALEREGRLGANR